ncbi:MAG: tetratricopeptide repeat protein [Ignavibacteria bacterium]|nr:tetratricopeptide repeat protein [Ignavibacteria bacterium]
MKRRALYYILITLGLGTIFIVGCSGSANDSAHNAALQKMEANRKVGCDQAMEHYVTGLGMEAKGDYAAAILEFQEGVQLCPQPSIYYSLGKDYYLLNKLASALPNARRAVELDSTNTEYMFLLVEIYNASRLQDSAIAVLNSILRRDSTDDESASKLALLYENTQPKKALAIYRNVLNHIGSEITILKHMAEIYERIGDLNGCITVVREISQTDSDNLPLQLLLTDLLIKNKQEDSALTHLTSLEEFFPNEILLMEKKGQILLSKGKLKEASPYYLKAFNDTTVTKESKLRIGALYFAASFKDSTLLEVSKNMLAPLDKDTSDWDVRMYLGAIAIAEHKDSLALNYFHNVVTFAPWNSEAWFRIAGIYFDNHKYDEAIKTLSEVKEKFSEEFPINYLLGLSYMQLENYENACIHLKKASKLNPTEVNVLSAYGYSLNKANKTNEAILQLIHALALDSTNVEVMGTLGLIYDDKEMWSDCDSIYALALKLDSANATVNNNYAYSLSKRNIRLDEALRMVTTALLKEPANSSFLDTKGWIYYQMGRYSEAKELIEQSLKTGGEKSPILDHLGDVMFKLGNKSEAVNYWKKAFEKDSTKNDIKIKIEKGSL